MRRIPRRPIALIGLLLALLFTGLAPALAQTGAPPIVELVIGASTQGRPINAVRIGDGPRKLVLVGATHGWPERNTFELVTQIADYYRAHPADVPADIRLYIIPLLNPDGMALQTRLNANGVDLNRNMDTSADDCPENDWSQRVSGAYGTISDTGGPYSESEIESRTIRDFLLDADAVVFFHSNAGVVFPACGHQPSIELARIFADGAGYAFIPVWDRYPITGGMHDWAGGLGITAITPELVTGDQPEFAQNLGGTQAILGAVSAIPPPQPHVEGGVEVAPVIWRAWKAWGGQRLFGLPIGPPVTTPDGTTQLFERARFEYRPAQRDSVSVAQIGALGRDLLGVSAAPPEAPQPDGRFFAETGRNVDPIFAAYWRINGGLPIFGLPIGPAEATIDDRGEPAIQQPFERAVLTRPAGSGSQLDVRLAPLGRIQQAQQDARSPETAIRAR